MAANLIKTLDGKDSGRVILVAGGFHSEGIIQKLNDAGIGTVTFVPAIKSVDTDNGSAYLINSARLNL